MSNVDFKPSVTLFVGLSEDEQVLLENYRAALPVFRPLALRLVEIVRALNHADDPTAAKTKLQNFVECFERIPMSERSKFCDRILEDHPPSDEAMRADPNDWLALEDRPFFKRFQRAVDEMVAWEQKNGKL